MKYKNFRQLKKHVTSVSYVVNVTIATMHFTCSINKNLRLFFFSILNMCLNTHLICSNSSCQHNICSSKNASQIFSKCISVISRFVRIIWVAGINFILNEKLLLVTIVTFVKLHVADIWLTLFTMISVYHFNLKLL